jgi:hypothetical protein
MMKIVFSSYNVTLKHVIVIADWRKKGEPHTEFKDTRIQS